MTKDKELAEAFDLIERLASAGRRLERLASGVEVPDGDMVSACKEGMFCEEIAQRRIRWLLRCEAAIKSMSEQICSPKTSPEQFVADCLGEKAPGRRASR